MMRLSEIALVTKGNLVGTDVEIKSVGTDSRAIQAQQLFVALKGENFDGHDYAAQSLQQGAAAVLVSANVASPAVLVKNTRLALGELAAHWRQKFSMPVVAITGSNGKTTVKEMLAAILRAAAGADEKVLATQGNLNNDIGLPLTMLNLNQQHEFAVFEMGMNHLGEIRYLTKLAKPNVALVNNAGSAHIGELGSYEAIAEAKGEIFEGLDSDGIAIINADDKFADYWKKCAAKNKQMTFGLNSVADVTARFVLNPMSSDIQLITPIGNVNIDLPAPGEHNVRNAIAAATAALAIHVPLNKIAQGLTHFSGVQGRLQSKPGVAGAQIIDDTYNANPASMKAAIDVLAANQGKRIFVMGDMAELGEGAPKMHAEIGAYAKSAGIDSFFAVGKLTNEAAKAFGPSAQHFENIELLADALKKQMNSNVTVLVKGSRSARMERVVDLIQVSKIIENKKGKH